MYIDEGETPAWSDGVIRASLQVGPIPADIRIDVAIMVLTGSPVAVLVQERRDSLGRTAAQAFSAVADTICAALEIDASQVLWILHWPGHALASAVFHDRLAADAYLMLADSTGWQALALNRADATTALTLFGEAAVPVI